MKPQSRDTSPRTERYLIEQLRKMPAYIKARQSAELTRTCRELALSGIRRRYPDASDRECELRLAALWLDRDIMVKAFHWDPEENNL